MRVPNIRVGLLATVATAAFVSTQAFAQGPQAQPNPETTVAQDAAGATQAEDDQATEQVAAEASDQTIVVTARRRNEVLLDVPIAVTAYSGEQLNRQGALDITDIADTTPNVTLEVSRGTNSTLTPFIRGIGQQDPVAGFEQGVGLYIDDVYLNRPQAAVLNIFDVERIEVLRGPQGTLYGRNTIGGAIKYVTRRIRTDGPHGNVRVNVGNHGHKDLIASVSTPLTQGLLIGAAVARLTNNGFGENLTTCDENYNRDIWAARGTIELIPTDDIFVRLSADKTWDDSNARGGHRLIPNLCATTGNFGCAGNFPVLDNVFDTRGGLEDPEQKVRAWGDHCGPRRASTTGSRSATSPRSQGRELHADRLRRFAFRGRRVPAIYRNRQFSQEVQLVADRGPLQASSDSII